MMYQLDLSGEGLDAALAVYEQYFAGPGEHDPFALELVRGCHGALEAIDAKIREVSRHWRLERMARVDRNILRLGTYELMYLAEVPRKVTLNEAVELAKRYGDENSPAFINGVLDRIASEIAKP